ncbi:MAG TPA: hypothetical protein PLS07_05195 [Niabella sp.]|nr:hypothetical protein [Niabella sp.]HQW14585.1 hypothetical protein [Niabella sp.]HQX19726.1 hypothetical protein [Niabella sp.]HQX41699.1 hypothetical protein [Niabella sp.]HRB07537.1 hypothetical protein [Niabella sp.]
MKKLFAIALIAISFAACNSGETTTEEATTDTTAVAPAPEVVAPVADSGATVSTDTTATAAPADSAK